MNMNIPDKSKKISQHNFGSYRESREWLSNNGFRSKGMVLEEPWRSLFVEYWAKEGFVALSMDITFIPDSFNTLSLQDFEKPYQVDIATSE